MLGHRAPGSQARVLPAYSQRSKTSEQAVPPTRREKYGTLPRALTVPGYTGASPDHWMTHLEHLWAGVERVQQHDWNIVEREGWVRRIGDAVEADDSPVILIGHSCGAVACAQYLANSPAPNVLGALLVAPADVDAEDALSAIRPQAPLPSARLKAPTHMIISDNDPHLRWNRALALAETWGSSVEVVPGGGHIATADGYGSWPHIVDVLSHLSRSLT